MNTGEADDLYAERRTELGVGPDESDPTRMLGIVWLVVAGVVLLGLAFAIAEGWLW